MTGSLDDVFNSVESKRALRMGESLRVQNDSLGGTVTEKFAGWRSQLRVAAQASFTQLLHLSIGELLRRLGSNDAAESNGYPFHADAEPVFWRWHALLSELLNTGEKVSLDDWMSYVSAGFLAKRSTDVRGLLRSEKGRASIGADAGSLQSSDWLLEVRNHSTRALLLLCSQQNHEDISAAKVLIERLAKAQAEMEKHWLNSVEGQYQPPLSLLVHYHVALAVMRIAEFLLTGAVRSSDGRLVDVLPELKRLISAAGDLIEHGKDALLEQWVLAVASVLWLLREESVWVSVRGMSQRIDELLGAMVAEGRAEPVFSLLPSQRDALRQNLLDPNRIAVVLQMPTSGGKTLLAEFAIVQALEAYREVSRIIYVTPTRALATQVRRTLTENLRPLRIEVAPAGSAWEDDPFELQLLQKTAGVIVVTPEKLDLLFRSAPPWFKDVRLVVVDEAHLLNDGERGVRLELLLANLRREHPQARLLLLTPFIQNAKEIAAWLGGSRSTSVEVHWRPSRVILGHTVAEGRGTNKRFVIEWSDPVYPDRTPAPLSLAVPTPSPRLSSAVDRITWLAGKIGRGGSTLVMCAHARKDAEEIAERVATSRQPIPDAKRSPALRVAIALAKEDYGENSLLASALERGVAYHHSALSSLMRYLIESEMRARNLTFIAATTTLAQGVNFPVSSVLVHSVSKPNQAGDLTASEFWNIAGRAGRVGWSDNGFVVFAARNAREDWERYGRALNESVRSALLSILANISNLNDLKRLYRQESAVRPLIQYLSHAAASLSPQTALASLEELLQGSLALRQAESAEQVKKVRDLARAFLSLIQPQKKGYLKAADETGFGVFSFDEIFAKVANNALLAQGPAKLMQNGADGLKELVEVLRWLPELNLAIGYGQGDMDVEAVAGVVRSWIEGKSLKELLPTFPGDDDAAKSRNAGTYLYSTVSQTISWGAHAYMRAWMLQQNKSADKTATEDLMLPAYIQYGVSTPEAALASLLSMPRPLAEQFGALYREKNGSLMPEDALKFKAFLEDSPTGAWSEVLGKSRLAGKVSADDARAVWRGMQGLTV